MEGSLGEGSGSTTTPFPPIQPPPPYHVALTRQLIQGRDGGDPICATIMQEELERLFVQDRISGVRARVYVGVCIRVYQGC